MMQKRDELNLMIHEESELYFTPSEINMKDYLRIELGTPTHTLILDRIPIRFEETMNLVRDQYGSGVFSAFLELKKIASALTFDKKKLESDLYFEMTINKNQI